jgi:hypothetical protein
VGRIFVTFAALILVTCHAMSFMAFSNASPCEKLVVDHMQLMRFFSLKTLTCTETVMKGVQSHKGSKVTQSVLIVQRA